MRSTNIKLLLCSSAIAIVGALALEGCSSSDSSGGAGGGTSSGGTSSGGKGGTSSGGASTGGTSSGGAATGGTSSGGTSSGGASTGGTSSGGASSGGTGGASGSTSSGGAGAGGTGTAGTGGTGGTGGSGGGAGVDCTTFCNDEETICKFGAADMAPYANKGACMTACMGFTPGDVGVYPAGPTSGDTFACRRWHLSKAGDTGPVATHCPHTGLVSKNAYTDGSATGPCK